MHSTHSQAKSFVVEKFIKTLKNKNYKHMTAVSKKFYIDKLDDIVNEHNNTYHRKIKIKHIEVKDNIYRGSKKAPYFVFHSKVAFASFFQMVQTASLRNSSDNNMDPIGRYTTQKQIKIVGTYFAGKSVLLVGTYFAAKSVLLTRRQKKILAGTMYLMEGQFKVWWPNFGRQEVWQMLTKTDIVHLSAYFLRIFRSYGNTMRNSPENQHAVSHKKLAFREHQFWGCSMMTLSSYKIQTLQRQTDQNKP